MVHRTAAALLAASFLCLQFLPAAAQAQNHQAQNQMGYQRLSGQQATALPRRGGALSMDIGPTQQINEGGMAFELLRVNGVRRGSPGAQASFNIGDQIIAVDGRVFPSVVVFAAYLGSVQPGRQITVDYLPSGGGPQQAQHVGVTVGAGGQAVATERGDPARSGGLSTGSKIAIGVGAAALFGCYEFGCFSRSHPSSGNSSQQPVQQQPGVFQQQ